MNEPPPLPSSTGIPPRNGLSIASLVLGILSFAGCTVLTAIPAIITGHIARRRAKREPEIYGGRGMALAGLILGYGGIALIIVIGIAAAFVLPKLAKNEVFYSHSQPSACVSQLKQISLAAHSWANDHNDTFPPDFLTMSNELFSPKILACPEDPFKTRVENWAEFNPTNNLSYEFLLPGAKVAEVQSQEAFRCPNHGHVARGDGSVEEARRRR
jgi:hypothetical protein